MYGCALCTWGYSEVVAQWADVRQCRAEWSHDVLRVRGLCARPANEREDELALRHREHTLDGVGDGVKHDYLRTHSCLTHNKPSQAPKTRNRNQHAIVIAYSFTMNMLLQLRCFSSRMLLQSHNSFKVQQNKNATPHGVQWPKASKGDQ